MGRAGTCRHNKTTDALKYGASLLMLANLSKLESVNTSFHKNKLMQFPDYPSSASRDTVVNGHRMHFLERGGENSHTVVMLHGNPGWSFYYRRLFTALADSYHCIVPDHIGMGLSDKPAASDYSFTLEQRVDDLDALLSERNIGDTLTLLVHDWGGMIGLAYASRHPEKIRRLVISNTAGFLIPQGKSIPWQLRLARIPYFGALLICGMNAFCRGAITQCVKRAPLKNAVAESYLSPYNSWQHRLAVLRFVKDIPLHENHISFPLVQHVDRHLQQFSSLPILVCWGMRDFVFDRDFLDEWKRRFPEADYHEYDDAGHYLLEDAGEEVIPVIKAFLDRT